MEAIRLAMNRPAVRRIRDKRGNSLYHILEQQLLRARKISPNSTLGHCTSISREEPPLPGMLSRRVTGLPAGAEVPPELQHEVDAGVDRFFIGRSVFEAGMKVVRDICRCPTKKTKRHTAPEIPL